MYQNLHILKRGLDLQFEFTGEILLQIKTLLVPVESVIQEEFTEQSTETQTHKHAILVYLFFQV